MKSFLSRFGALVLSVLSGFDRLRFRDCSLLLCNARGDFLVQGFRNHDVRAALFGDMADEAVRCRQAARVTRQLRQLRAHGLINKVQKTHRYQISAQGRCVLSALLSAHAADTNRLAAAG